MKPGVEIDLSGAPLAWSADFSRAWKDCLSRAAGDVPGHIRPEAAGDRVLREELAYRTGLSADRLTITGGIRAAAAAILGRARTVVVEQPTFADVPRALEARGVRVLRAHWENIPGMVQTADAAWVTPVLRNPDAQNLDAGVADALVLAANGRADVVWDMAFAWFARPAAPAPVPPGVHVLGSMHKLAGPGARLGWAALATDNIDVRRALWLTSPPLVWQRSWAYLFQTGVLDELRDQLRETLELASTGFLAAAGLPISPAVPHMLLRVSDENAVLRGLAGKVRVNPGSAFDTPEPSIRVSLLGVDPHDARLAGEAMYRVLHDHTVS